YPADVSKRAKIHSVLDWHHLNLRYGASTVIFFSPSSLDLDALLRYVLHTTLGPALGRPSNPEAAAKAEKVLDSSLSKIESVWLKGSGKFLLVLDEKDRNRILSPYKKVQAWIEATKASTQPHFDEVHEILYRAKANFQKQRENAKLHSKIIRDPQTTVTDKATVAAPAVQGPASMAMSVLTPIAILTSTATNAGESFLSEMVNLIVEIAAT
ncbi:Glutathione S-transferase T1, partial [Bienertia sinuspersici]